MTQSADANSEAAVPSDRDAHLSAYFGTGRHSERDEERRIHGFAHNYQDQLPAPGGSCLEIGPGKGEILGWLAERGYRVHALDVSSEVVDYCNRSMPGCAELVSDTAAWLSAHAAEFDMVVMLHVLEHLPKA